MKNVTRSSALLLCLGLASAGSAQAAELGWYVLGFGGETSASVSQAQMDENVLDIFEGLTVESFDSTLDDSDTGFGLGAGYQLNDYIAFEFSYVDLGTISHNSSVTASDGTDQIEADVLFESEADGAVVSALGMWPLGERFSLFARAGLSLLQADGSARISLDDGSVNRASQSSQKADPMFGVGAEFSVTKYFAIRVGWDRYLDVGTSDVAGDTDADMISLGLRFGTGWFR